MWRVAVGRLYYRYGLFCASHPLKVILAVQVVIVLCAVPYLEHVFTSSQDPLPTKWSAPFDTDAASEAAFVDSYGSFPAARLRHFVIAANASVPPDGLSHATQAQPNLSVGTKPARVDRGVLTKDAVALSTAIVDRLRAFRASVAGSTYGLSEFCFHQPGEDCAVVSAGDVFGHSLARFDADADLAVMLSGERPGRDATARAVADAVVWDVRRHPNGTAYGAGAMCIVVALRHMPSGKLEIEHEFFRQFLSSLPRDLFSKRALSVDAQPVFPVEGAADMLSRDRYARPSARVYYEFRDEERGSADVWFLVLSYAIVFLYISFSIGKFHLVKSKFGLGFTAVVIVFCSMVMSVGICTALGVPPTLMSIEVIPFLVIAIGVENIFVITNSVVSTSLDLPVKIRIAEGMSQVGLSITMSLMTEIGLVLVGMGTSIPALQEFCYFAFVGILADFFLQITLFPTVLSIDIRRMELSDLQHHRVVERRPPSHSVTPTHGKPSQAVLNGHAKGAAVTGADRVQTDAWAARGTSVKSGGVGSTLFSPYIVKTVIVVLFMLVLAVGLYSNAPATQPTTPDAPGLPEPSYSVWRLLSGHAGISLRHRYVELYSPIAVAMVPSAARARPGEALGAPDMLRDGARAVAVEQIAGKLGTVAAFLRNHHAVLQAVLIVSVISLVAYSVALRLWPRLVAEAPKVTCAWADPAAPLDEMVLPEHPTHAVGSAAPAPASPGRPEIECLQCDGHRVVSVGIDGVLLCHDAHTGELRLRMVCGGPAIWCLRLTGSLCAVGAADGVVRVFDLDFAASHPPRRVTPPSSPGAPDGAPIPRSQSVSHVGSGAAPTHPPPAADSLAPGTTSKPPSPSSVPRNGQHAAKASPAANGAPGDRKPRSVSMSSAQANGTPGGHPPPPYATGEFVKPLRFTLKGHEGGVTCLWVVELSSPLLVSGGVDGTLRVWDLGTGAQAHVLRAHKQGVSCLQGASGRIVSGSNDGMLKIHRVADGHCLYTLYGHPRGITSLHIDGSTIASGSADGSVRMWGLDDGVCKFVLTGHAASVLAIRSDLGACRFVATASLDETVRVWDVESGRCVHVLQHFCADMVLFPLSATLVCGGQGCLKAFDLAAGVCVRTVKLAGPRKGRLLGFFGSRREQGASAHDVAAHNGESAHAHTRTHSPFSLEADDDAAALVNRVVPVGEHVVCEHDGRVILVGPPSPIRHLE